MLRVAPLIVLQCAPFASQRYHWYAYEMPPLPDQTPAVPVSCFPCWSVPAIDGPASATGPGATRMTALAALSTACAFDSVTVAAST